MVFEWIMGNFFPMMVQGLFAVFWLSFGMLQLPTLQLGAPYATPEDPSGLASREYNAVVALYLIVWGFALFTFFIFTCKINAVFASIFLLVSVASWVLSGAYWNVSWGNYEAASQLQKVCPPSACATRRIKVMLSVDIVGRGGSAVHSRCFGLVYVLHYHGGRDAHYFEPPSGRFEPILAQDRR